MIRQRKKKEIYEAYAGIVVHTRGDKKNRSAGVRQRQLIQSGQMKGAGVKLPYPSMRVATRGRPRGHSEESSKKGDGI